MIPDAGVSLNVSPLPDLRITEGMCLAKHEVPDLTIGKGRVPYKSMGLFQIGNIP